MEKKNVRQRQWTHWGIEPQRAEATVLIATNSTKYPLDLADIFQLLIFMLLYPADCTVVYCLQFVYMLGKEYTHYLQYMT